MARRTARAVLVAAALLALAPAAPASALPCGYKLHAFCSAVCRTDPAVQEACDSVEPPPPAH